MIDVPMTNVVERLDEHRGGTPGMGEAPSSRLRLTLVVWAVSSLLLLALLSDRLVAPPLWDAAWSTWAGAAELSRNGFDWLEILSSPPMTQGGPGSHSSSLLTLVQGVLLLMFDSPQDALLAAHLIMIVAGGGLVAATFSLARRYVSLGTSLAVSGAVLLLPLIVQQVADPYIDLPLGLFAVLAVSAFIDGKRTSVALYTGLAVWCKPTGLILLPLVALAGLRGESRRWRKNGVAVLVAAAPISFEVVRRMAAPHGAQSPTVETTVGLLANALWILGVTTDVFLILVVGCLAAYRRRSTHPKLVLAVGVVTGGFFALHLTTIVLSQTISVLPRYYVAVVPLWIVLIAVDLSETHSRRIAIGALMALMAFSVINWSGRFYPLADHPQAPMAERSPGGGHSYLEMEIAGTRALADAAGGVEAIVLDQMMQFRFRYPELGFLSETPSNTISTAELVDDPPSSFARLYEPHISASDRDPGVIAGEGGWDVSVEAVWTDRWVSELMVAAVR